MAYADVVIIVGRRLQDVEDVFMSLVEQTNKMGLEINEKRTKFIIVFIDIVLFWSSAGVTITYDYWSQHVFYVFRLLLYVTVSHHFQRCLI